MFFPKFLAQALLLSGAAWATPIGPDTDAQVGSPLLEGTEFAEFPSGDVPEVAMKAALAENAVAPSEASLTSDETQALNLHNTARATKGLPPLVWDPTLAANAQSWANALRATGAFAHSPSFSRPGQGENLAYNSAPLDPKAFPNPLSLGTQQWLNESVFYKGETMPGANFGKYGHYTQIMWNGTTKVGVASANNGRGTVWIVARYSPPGNVVGQKPYN